MSEANGNGNGVDPTFRTDADLNELMGLFDAPAFARRGQDVEYALQSLHTRCVRKREELLEMVRVRLRQWAGAAVGPADWSDVLRAPIEDLWPLSGAEEPRWAEASASLRRRRAVVRDLIASVERFNARWRRFVEELDPTAINAMIADYNEFYPLEKECALGSARLARIGFRPLAPVSAASLLAEHPALPVPEAR